MIATEQSAHHSPNRSVAVAHPPPTDNQRLLSTSNLLMRHHNQSDHPPTMPLATDQPMTYHDDEGKSNAVGGAMVMTSAPVAPSSLKEASVFSTKESSMGPMTPKESSSSSPTLADPTLQATPMMNMPESTPDVTSASGRQALETAPAPPLPPHGGNGVGGSAQLLLGTTTPASIQRSNNPLDSSTLPKARGGPPEGRGEHPRGPRPTPTATTPSSTAPLTRGVQRSPSTGGSRSTSASSRADAAAAAAAAATAALVQPHAAFKVIKGEIHNVITVMRADQRYVSLSRFTEEMIVAAPAPLSGSGTLLNSSSHHHQAPAPDGLEPSHPSTSLAAPNASWHHPLVQQLQDLHATLTEQQQEQVTLLLQRHQQQQQQQQQNQNQSNTPLPRASTKMRMQNPWLTGPNMIAAHLSNSRQALTAVAPDPLVYLPPFCQAVTGRDISAAVTGAALAALHKFLLYGFLWPSSPYPIHHPGRNGGGRPPSSNHVESPNGPREDVIDDDDDSQAENAWETVQVAMGMLADALLKCAFEESSASSSHHHHHAPSTPSAGMDTSGRKRPSTPPTSRHGPQNGGGGSSRDLYNHHKASTSPAVAGTPPHGPTGAGPGAIVSRFGGGGRSNSATAAAANHKDEQAVLILLEVSALTVRSALQAPVCLLSARHMVGLLDTCLHVSHRAHQASPLLKAAAASALSQIVMQVFSTPQGAFQHSIDSYHGSGVHDDDDGESYRDGYENVIVQAREGILVRLASLLNPAMHPQSVTASSLTLVNIALETHREPLRWAEMDILQNQVCKFLLQWSTTHDLQILSLTLRVIFNLFQSIRNHAKVPLEVFLTSVHLRILLMTTDVAPTGHTAALQEEKKEVVLESLLEFCQEPALMQDIYLNYDCDVACTNLYEAIVTALGKVATPAGYQLFPSLVSTPAPEEEVSDHAATTSPSKSKSATAPASITITAPLNHLNRLALDGLIAILDSIAKRCQQSKRMTRSPSSISSDGLAQETNDSNSEEGSLTNYTNTGSGNLMAGSSPSSEEEFAARKRRKHALVKVAHVFNEGPMKTGWVQLAVQEGVLDSADAYQQIAQLLYDAPEVDKTKLGEYLSKGPAKDYPEYAQIRQYFVECYNFAEMTFAAALRKFLSKFRLPGEAQCIDRLMESFSIELYKQQGQSTFFKNADAVYVLAFSTIMLNTDLHNPNLKGEKRMTKDQFIRNNRGINDGSDLPEEFLGELYDQIKSNQIQVRKELGEFIKRHEHEDFRTTWENMLSKSAEVATPFFASAGLSSAVSRAGVHDREMFVVLARPALQALAGVFMRSWDDTVVVRALKGLQQLVKVAVFFEMDSIVNDTAQVLLMRARDYIATCVTIENNADGGGSVSSNPRTVTSTESVDDDETNFIDTEQPIPYGLLCCSGRVDEIDITGSASHRGMLAMDCGFIIMRRYASRVTGAWPSFIDCLCALRDVRALPAGLADLDDFADSHGTVLPRSPFARASQRRVDEYYRSVSDKDANKHTSWFRSLFRKASKSKENDDSAIDESSARHQSKGEFSAYARTLLAIAEAADVEQIVQMGSAKLPSAEKTIISLLSNVEGYPFDGDAVLEQHAVFCLELAARALLSHRERATELFHLFLSNFESVLGRVSEKKVPAPFLIERIVVTILRCCIHLYELHELRPHLRTALHLLMMSLPRSFIRVIADRISCGLAIILRSSFHFFETANEWTFMGDTLDMLANYSMSRVFVFDGIASTVEYALPNNEATERANDGMEGDTADHPTLSKDACIALSRVLIRFVLGYYSGDVSLSIPAMLCLEKVYRHKTRLLLQNLNSVVDNKVSSSIQLVPDKSDWQNLVVAVYSICRSPDVMMSRHGVDCFLRITLQTPVDEMPIEKWLDVVYLIVNKQPPISADASRACTFSMLGQILMKVLPPISRIAEYREDLEDLVNQVAVLAQENLRQGRRGRVSPMFEKTLQSVTYLSNHMVSEEWDGDPQFSVWASETLLAELERVGAAGASSKNQAAVKPIASKPSMDTVAEADEEALNDDAE